MAVEIREYNGCRDIQTEPHEWVSVRFLDYIDMDGQTRCRFIDVLGWESFPDHKNDEWSTRLVSLEHARALRDELDSAIAEWEAS